ncbi:MAG TPA: hypothetical protein VFV46_06575 [Lacibacter sp.]|nr:hypothetical protein [Lacibacter sp.]
MFKNSCLIIMLIVVQSCVVIPTYVSNISLTTVEHDASLSKIDRVLLVGAGKIPTRVFLENLSGSMKSLLKENGITSDYLFMNTMPVPFRLQDSAATSTYDAFLVFRTANDTYLDLHNKKYIAAGPGIYGEGFGTQYTETFTITLYRPEATLKTIWRGKLEVDFDIVNETKYHKITKLLYKELLRKKVIVK